MHGGYTYILGSPTGVLYIGVTSDLDTRIRQHKNGTLEGSSKQHNCTRLLYYDHHSLMLRAIARETQLKNWRREKKLALIRTLNPVFKDLAQRLDWKFVTQHGKIASQSSDAR